MMVSATVTLDAGILAVPSDTTTAYPAHRFVEALLDWAKLLDEPWVAIYMSEGAFEALINDGLYPFRDELHRLFSAHGIVEYDVNTVALVAERFVRLTPSFEAYFSVRDALFDELATTPDVLQLCAGPNLRTELARWIVLMAILRRHCGGVVQGHALVLCEAPDRVVRVRALVLQLEHQRDDLGTVASPPDYFEGDVLACDSFAGYSGASTSALYFEALETTLGSRLPVEWQSSRRSKRAVRTQNGRTWLGGGLGHGFEIARNGVAKTHPMRFRRRCYARSQRQSKETTCEPFTRSGPALGATTRRGDEHGITRGLGAETSTMIATSITGNSRTVPSN